MIRYLFRRLLAMGLTFWAMTLVAFLIMELPPGDFASTRVSEMSAAGAKIDPAMVLRLREMYQLDAPLLERYANWFLRVLHGDFGYSLAFNTPVTGLILRQLPNTLLVDGLTLLVMWGIAIPIGIYSAVRQYSVGDYVATVLGFVGVAVPSFLLALLLMWIAYANFGVVLGGLHSQEFSEAPLSGPALIDLAQHLWAPILIAGASGMASLIRVTRANLLDELNKPYVTTARAKGLSEWHLILKYPVRMAMSPLVSSLGWILPSLISSSTIVAIVMNMPTLGPLLLNGLLVQDMFLAGGVLVVMAILTLIGTLFSDIALFWLDPRVRVAAL
ncbi:MAG: ABC transporter permease [Devosia sp.]|nr:ABC transporter permease [Devosia sp.]